MKNILFFLFFLASSQRSFACDCDSIKGLNESEIVFIGKVAEITQIDSPFNRYEILFEVRQSIKGIKNQKRIKINVKCLLDMCCGIPFESGQCYIIYAYRKYGLLYTGLCTESRKLD